MLFSPLPTAVFDPSFTLVALICPKTHWSCRITLGQAFAWLWDFTILRSQVWQCGCWRDFALQYLTEKYRLHLQRYHYSPIPSATIVSFEGSKKLIYFQMAHSSLCFVSWIDELSTANYGHLQLNALVLSLWLSSSWPGPPLGHLAWLIALFWALSYPYLNLPSSFVASIILLQLFVWLQSCGNHLQ